MEYCLLTGALIVKSEFVKYKQLLLVFMLQLKQHNI